VPEYKWPKFGKNRGRGFWAGVAGIANIWKSRRKVSPVVPTFAAS